MSEDHSIPKPTINWLIDTIVTVHSPLIDFNVKRLRDLIDQERQQAALEAKYEVLEDLLKWNEAWHPLHPDKPFNWHGAVAAMMAMKEPQIPFHVFREQERQEK